METQKLIVMFKADNVETRIIYQDENTNEYTMLIVNPIEDTIRIKTPSEEYVKYCVNRYTEWGKTPIEAPELSETEKAYIDSNRKLLAMKKYRKRTGVPFLCSKIKAEAYESKMKLATPPTYEEDHNYKERGFNGTAYDDVLDDLPPRLPDNAVYMRSYTFFSELFYESEIIHEPMEPL